MHLIEQAFGEGCDLYQDVLQCAKTDEAAKLRKAYYRRALQFHPDKVKGKEIQFQAVSLAYQLLQDPLTKQAYDETGEIPPENDEEDETSGSNQWRAYFTAMFGQVTTQRIDEFASKYKCSDEERRDVLKEFTKRKGNLVKMLEFVMLSQPADAVRWVPDYLEPALAAGEVADYRDAMEKSLKKIQKMVEKNQQELEDETESEDSVEPQKKKSATKKPSQKKAKKENGMADLVAQIQNKKRGRDIMASLGARYGVAAEEDPLADDAEFARIQARLQKKKRT